jgi:hypothetical protein
MATVKPQHDAEVKYQAKLSLPEPLTGENHQIRQSVNGASMYPRISFDQMLREAKRF